MYKLIRLGYVRGKCKEEDQPLRGASCLSELPSSNSSKKPDLMVIDFPP